MKKKILAISLIIAVILSFTSVYVYNRFEYWNLNEIDGQTTLLTPNPHPNKTYNAFPKVIRVSHPEENINNTILAVWYSGDKHVDSNGDGQIFGSISEDEAASWGKPFKIYDDPNYDCRNIGIVNSINGSIIIFFAKVNVSKMENKTAAWVDFGYIKSYNGGRNWSNFISIIHEPEFSSQGILTGNGYGDPIFIENEIYVLCYGYPDHLRFSETHSSFLLKSTDNGESWILINTLSINTGVSTGESDFWMVDNYIFGFTRTQNSDKRYLYFFESPDVSFQWQNLKQTNILGDCPDILRLGDGRFVVAIRAFGKNTNYLGYFLLPSNFTELDFSEKENLFSNIELNCLVRTTFGTHYGNIAYPSMILLSEMRILVVYYDIEAGGIFAKIVSEASL